MLKTIKYSKIPVPNPEDVLDYLPEGDFDWPADTADDWVPSWCDSCETWHRYSYPVSYNRTDGVLTVTMHSVDSDGDWEIVGEYSSDEPDTWEEFYRFYYAPKAYEDCKAWAEYFDWMLDNNLEDPAEEWFGEPDRDRVEKSRDDCIKGANIYAQRLMQTE